MTTINLGKIKPLYKGAYAGGVTYRPLDFTLYSGNLYVCKASSTGNLPTDPAYFDPVASVNAASIPNTPAGSISSTTVQAALNELDVEKVAKTDVIAIAKGGTGATTANAAADAIGAFRRGTLLGTVSQSAGVPTGAVVERGSNANGGYVRFADGTQICTLVSSPFSISVGSTTWSWAFPASFSGQPHIDIRLIGGYSGTWKVETEQWSATASNGFIHNSGAAGYDVQRSCLAVGRWF